MQSFRNQVDWVSSDIFRKGYRKQNENMYSDDWLTVSKCIITSDYNKNNIARNNGLWFYDLIIILFRNMLFVFLQNVILRSEGG